MRLPGCAWFALSSLLLTPLTAATRPRYGGTLTVELPSAWATLNPADTVADVTSQSEREALLPLIAETLVRLNAKGEADADLAVNWQRDADRKRWRFSLRSKVTFHDGEPLTAAIAAPVLLAALKKTHPDVAVTGGGQTLLVQSEHPMPDLLTELSRSRNAIARNSDKDPLIGTGSFRVATWEPGHRLALAAFEDYWAGRPYLDSIIINMSPSRSVADVIALPVGPSRRVLPEHMRIWSSLSRDLLAILPGKLDPAICQALEFSIDRAPIVNVLAQRHGEPAFGLLPQWLSGYSFLFTVQTDVARARTTLGQMRIAPLTLGYPPNDAFARLVAERVALNARDAGLMIEPTTNPNAGTRLVRLPLESTDAVAELLRIADLLGVSEHPIALTAAKPETLFEFERSLLETHKMMPLVYLPEVYGVSPRVHDWDAAQKDHGFTLHLDNIWVDP